MKTGESNRSADMVMMLAVISLFVIFALFVHQKNLSFTISILALSGICLIMASCLNGAKDIPAEFRLANFRRIGLAAVGILTGIIYSAAYKLSYNYELFSFKFSHVIFIVFLIGVTEELVFRGFVQTRLKRYGKATAISVASCGHAAYKLSLFLMPAVFNAEGYLFLGLATFLGGMVFGLLTEISDNVIPASLGHGIFDIMVYGGLVSMPWWTV
jgi:membrane protease YdiL (CAAX protease family)